MFVYFLLGIRFVSMLLGIKTARRNRRKPGKFVPTLAVMAAMLYYFAAGPWQRRWGASDDEVAAEMPGDEVVRDANFSSTRALTIAAPPEAVWPWIVQLGQGRGGFYSYDFLENLASLGIHSSNRILPEFQELKVGDTIPLEPSGSGYKVARVDPGRVLLLTAQGDEDTTMGKVFRDMGIASTWVFQLIPQPENRTRLVVRWRAAFRWWQTRTR